MYPIETILETEYLKFFMLSTWFLYQIKQSGDRVKMPKINQEEMELPVNYRPIIRKEIELVTKNTSSKQKSRTR